MKRMLRYYITGVVTALVVGAVALPVHAAEIIATESVADKVRKVTIRQDNRATTERFELCVSGSGGWFEARKNASGEWVLTPAGQQNLAARQAANEATFNQHQRHLIRE